VAVAIGLGADAVMIGRAYLYGLMAGGSNGVEHAVNLITSELIQTMSLLGVTKISEISEDFLVRGTP
jgi:L-lactate dehydrogenase (cytochrome)